MACFACVWRFSLSAKLALVIEERPRPVLVAEAGWRLVSWLAIGDKDFVEESFSEAKSGE
jgi:hypothetical protein